MSQPSAESVSDPAERGPGASAESLAAARRDGIATLLATSDAPTMRGVGASVVADASRIAARAAAVLESRTHAPVRIEPATGRSAAVSSSSQSSSSQSPSSQSPSSRGPSSQGAVFGVEFAGGVAVTLDQNAARACIDALAVHLGGMRGTGELTSVDHGLLEALALEVVHRLHSEQPPNGAASELAIPALSAVHHEGELARRFSDARLRPLDFQVACGGREGRASVWLPSTTTGSIFAFPGRWDAPSGSVRATLRLPPVHLKAAERDSICEGDVLLLGLADLNGAPRCELVTTHGWRLANAAVVSDTATLVTVRAGALEPGPPTPAEERPGMVPVEITFGECLLDAAALEAWTGDRELALSKPPDVTALLHSGAPGAPGAPAARAVELVRIDAELGARVLGPAE